MPDTTNENHVVYKYQSYEMIHNQYITFAQYNCIVWQSGVKENTSARYMNNEVANIIRSVSCLVTGCEQASYAELTGNTAIARLWIFLSSEVC